MFFGDAKDAIQNLVEAVKAADQPPRSQLESQVVDWRDAIPPVARSGGWPPAAGTAFGADSGRVRA